MNNTNALLNKVAIVTGGGQGIGEAIAKAFASSGAKVIVTGRSLDSIQKVAEEITEAGGHAMAVLAESGNLQQTQQVVATAIEVYGGIDIIVNNAHTFTDSLALESADMASNIRVDMESGLIGSLFYMQAAFPHMKQAGGGSVINFGSSYGIRCEPGFLAYAASKEAIRALTKTSAKEWGRYNIRVNTILPAALSPKALWYLEETGTAAHELSKVALGYFGKPEEIAPLSVFLASDNASYITGQTIGAAGGSTML